MSSAAADMTATAAPRRPRGDELRPTLRGRDGRRAAGPQPDRPAASRHRPRTSTPWTSTSAAWPSNRSRPRRGSRSRAHTTAYVLDFDMGGFDAAPVAPPRAGRCAGAARAGRREEPLDFSFDMDFGAPAANPVRSRRPADRDRGRPAVRRLRPRRHHHRAPRGPAAAPNSDIDMANLAKRIRPAGPAGRAAGRHSGRSPGRRD